MIYPLNFSFSLSLLFMGFLLSNIFGILGSSKSIVFLFILCIESINCFVYTRKTKKVYGGLTSYPFSPFPFSFSFFLRQPKGKRQDTEGSFTSFVRASASRLLSFGRTSVRGERRKGQQPFGEKTGKGKGGRNGDEIATGRSFLSNLKRFFILIFSRFSYKVDSKEQQIEDQISKFKNTYRRDFVLNFFKIGFEFGFFVDAFKLGS